MSQRLAAASLRGPPIVHLSGRLKGAEDKSTARDKGRILGEPRRRGARSLFTITNFSYILRAFFFFFFLSWKDIYVIFPQLNKESFRLEYGRKVFLV